MGSLTLGEPVPPFPGCPHGMAAVPEVPPSSVGLTRARSGMVPGSDRAWNPEARAAWEDGSGIPAYVQAQLDNLLPAPPTPLAAAAAAAATPPAVSPAALLQ